MATTMADYFGDLQGKGMALDFTTEMSPHQIQTSQMIPRSTAQLPAASIEALKAAGFQGQSLDPTELSTLEELGATPPLHSHSRKLSSQTDLHPHLDTTRFWSEPPSFDAVTLQDAGMGSHDLNEAMLSFTSGSMSHLDPTLRDISLLEHTSRRNTTASDGSWSNDPSYVQRANSQIPTPRSLTESPSPEPSKEYKPQLSREEKLLLNLREECGMSWKDTATCFENELGKSYRVPALQMRYRRLKARMQFSPNDKNAIALRQAHRYWKKEKWRIISNKMAELGAPDSLSDMDCHRKWKQMKLHDLDQSNQPDE